MSTTEQMARLIAGLDERVGGLEGERRFANASLENAGFNEYDINGNLVSRTGKQQDGSHGSFSLGGQPPPRPTAATYRIEVDKAFIAWDGTFAAGPYEYAPLDWARCEVHIGPAEAEPYGFGSLKGSFESARGGELSVLGLPTDVDLYVWMVGRTQSGKFSTPSVKSGPFRVRTPADAAAALAKADQALAAATDAATKADEAEAAALAAAGLAGDANTAAGQALEASETAETAAGQAAGVADEALAAANKPRIIYTTSAPVGDTTVLWVPPPNNVPHKWNATTSEWVPIPDAAVKAATDKAIAAETAAGEAATAAQEALNASNTAAGKADTALTTAEGKNTVRYADAAPTAQTPGIRQGDLWYQFAPATLLVIGTWRWNGSIWQSVVLGDAVLATLTVGKLVSGTMNANVVIAGTIGTAASGARREMNAVGFQAWDDNNNLTISLDGVNNLLTGRYRTASSGRRIEFAAGGSLSQIDFWGAGTNRTFIRSFTEPDGKEAIQIGHGDPTTRGLDERININTAGWFTSRFRRTDFVVGEMWNLYGAAVDAGQQWMGYTANVKELVWRNIENEFSYHTHKTWYGLGALWHEQNDGFTWRVRPNPAADVDLKFNKNGRLGAYYGADAYYGGWWEFMEATQASSTSPKIGLFTNDGYGGYMRFNGGPGWNDMEFKYYDDSFFLNLQANAFIVQSDAVAKEGILDSDLDALAALTNTAVRKYRRTKVDKKDNVFTGGEEIGLVAQEAPAQIVSTSNSDGTLGIDVYQYVALVHLAVKQLADRLDLIDGKDSKAKKVPSVNGGPKLPKGVKK